VCAVIAGQKRAMSQCTFFPVEQRILDEFQKESTAAINRIELCVRALQISHAKLQNQSDNYEGRKQEEDALEAETKILRELHERLDHYMKLHQSNF
jgi:DNA repair ATPase RecN